MSEFVTTPRGDRVACDKRGSGPGMIFVAGAGPWRAMDPVTTETAELLAARGVTTIVYDRIGRGESVAGDGPIGLDRELAALSALIDDAGGHAYLCGHSSGCTIALRATVEGLAVDGLALWEAPIDPAAQGTGVWAAEVGRLLDDGDGSGAFRHYMKDMPPELLEAVSQVPGIVEQADSLRPDAESLVWALSAPHAELFGGIGVDVLAMVGDQTYDEMVPAAESIAASIDAASWKRVPGAEHTWQPEPMADELAAFVRG